MTQLLIKSGTVLSLDPEVLDLSVGDVLIEDGRIAAIAPTIAADGADIIDARDMIILPGLVNAHAHTWQTGLRGIAADWAVPQYMRMIHRRLATHFKPEDIYIANLVGALNQLNSGCTTLVDWCHNNPTPDHTNAAIDGLEAAGIRAVFMHGSPKPDPRPGQKHFSEIPMPRAEVERLRKGRLSSDDGLITLGLAMLGPAYSIYDVTEHDVRLAHELDLVASMHVGGGPMITPDGFDRLLRQQLIDRRINIVHGNNLAEPVLAGLVEAGASFTVTADVELQMGFGHPLTGRLRRLASPLSIGTDIESDVSGDLFNTLRTTLQVQRNLDLLPLIERGEALPDMTTIPCREALDWVTANGHYMVRHEDRIGTLRPGKEADVILVSTKDLNIFPVHNPITSIAMQANGSNVDTVIVAGRVMKRDGKLLRQNLPHLQQQLLESGRRILSAGGLRDLGRSAA